MFVSRIILNQILLNTLAYSSICAYHEGYKYESESTNGHHNHSRHSRVGQPSQRDRLLDLLTDYDRDTSPHDNQEPTEIAVQMIIQAFSSISSVFMEYGIDVYLLQKWCDPRLMFNETQSSLYIQDPELIAKVWLPDTYFTNVRDASVHQLNIPNINMRITHNGHLLYGMRLSMKLSCNHHLKMFPFDVQYCSTILSSYGNTDSVVRYNWAENSPISIQDDLNAFRFKFTHFEAKEMNTSTPIGNFSSLYVSFLLNRPNSFHLLQTFIPTGLVVVISWASFWLDPTAVPGRISLGVSTLLIMTTLTSNIRQKFNPSSHVHAMEQWLEACQLMVFAALLEFPLVNWLANRGKNVGNNNNSDSSIKIGERMHSIESGVVPSNGHLKRAHVVDYIARCIFPSIFITFNVFYWTFYTYSRSEQNPFPDLGI